MFLQSCGGGETQEQKSYPQYLADKLRRDRHEIVDAGTADREDTFTEVADRRIPNMPLFPLEEVQGPNNWVVDLGHMPGGRTRGLMYLGRPPGQRLSQSYRNTLPLAGSSSFRRTDGTFVDYGLVVYHNSAQMERVIKDNERAILERASKEFSGKLVRDTDFTVENIKEALGQVLVGIVEFWEQKTDENLPRLAIRGHSAKPNPFLPLDGGVGME